MSASRALDRNVCNERGHFARVCRAAARSATPRIGLNEGAHCLKPAEAVGIPVVVNIVQDLGPNLVMLLLKLLRTQ